MGWLSLFAVAIALAMDAFAVSIVAGLTLERITVRHMFRLAFHFGFFQAMMPVLGWSCGLVIHSYIAQIDHWIALSLLTFVGGRMVINAIRKNEEMHSASDPTTGWNLVILSIATSIDALAVGLSLAMIGSTIVVPALVIGFVAAFFTAAGMLLGQHIGIIWGKRVELLGGLILIGIGVKIVIEHTT